MQVAIKKCDLCEKDFQPHDLIAEIEINNQPLFCHFDCGSDHIDEAKEEGASWSIDDFYCDGISLRSKKSDADIAIYGQLHWMISGGFSIKNSKTVKYDILTNQWTLVPPEKPQLKPKESNQRKQLPLRLTALLDSIRHELEIANSETRKILHDEIKKILVENNQFGDNAKV